jgi:hypothetical protein
MCDDRISTGTGLEQVRLDKHPVAGLNECSHGAEQIDGQAYRIENSAAVVISAPD